MKVVPRTKSIYSFNPLHKPAEHVKLGEVFLLRTEDAFGGQIKTGKDRVDTLDWSRVDGATGPIFVDSAKPGDTLVVEILDIKVEGRGIIVTIPKHGILGGNRFKSLTKMVDISKGYVRFGSEIRVKASPMIGTIGVVPREGEVPSSSLGRHGGNMDVKELTAGTRLYMPVFAEGALFAAGDLHAVQANGELCISAIEVAGEILLRFGLIRGKRPFWPVLETRDQYELLACGETLDEAAKFATEAAVQAIMREYSWTFEEAYMFCSLVVDLEINQAVDPKKGVRATISKGFMTLDSLLAQ